MTTQTPAEEPQGPPRTGHADIDAALAGLDVEGQDPDVALERLTRAHEQINAALNRPEEN